MKKISIIFLLTLLPIIACADAVEIDGIWYNIIGKGKANVTYNPSGEKYTDEVIIPEKIIIGDDEYKVIGISSNAFEKCSGLSSIKIGDNVNYIGQEAFMGCSSLTSIKIPTSVKNIYRDAFKDCFVQSVDVSNLENWCNISFGNEYSNPVYYAKKINVNGVDITNLEIPNVVKAIGDYAFYRCRSLTSVSLPDGLISIGKHTFYGCNGLTKISIPNSIKEIGENAFEFTKLSSVHITDLESWLKINFNGYSSNPAFIAGHLYLNGEEIKDLEIPSSFDSIGDYTFAFCKGLTTVKIPNSVKTIGNYAFDGCTNINDLIIGKGVRKIGMGSFAECFSLKSIILPNSIETIGDNAFNNCSNLTSLNLGCSVKFLGSGVFTFCKNLASIVIPKSVTLIGSCAFSFCDKLIDVYCLSEKVKFMPNEDEGLYTENYTFDYANPENKTLHVPASSIEAYKNIDPWCNFKEIIALKEDEFPNVPKCATPKVEIVGGEIVFKCETEEVEFISEVKVPDPKNSYDSKISTPKKYSVSVYAVKANYENSDTATAEFDFSSDTSLSGDVDGNGIVNVADHVKLSSIILDQNE